jgi:hypothetical protein
VIVDDQRQRDGRHAVRFVQAGRSAGSRDSSGCGREAGTS